MSTLLRDVDMAPGHCIPNSKCPNETGSRDCRLELFATEGDYPEDWYLVEGHILRSEVIDRWTHLQRRHSFIIKNLREYVSSEIVNLAAD